MNGAPLSLNALPSRSLVGVTVEPVQPVSQQSEMAHVQTGTDQSLTPDSATY